MATFERAVKTYNGIMNAICHEHVTIGTSYSEGTENWNLRDLVSEMQYVLDLWNEPGSLPWEDAHDDSQPSHKPWLKNWNNERARMMRFIQRYAPECDDMECSERHCSCFD